MSYKGRVLQQVTDRMVRYNRLLPRSVWVLFFYLHKSLTVFFITFWSHTVSVFPTGTLSTTNPRALFCPVLVLSLPPPLQLLPGACKTDGPDCNQKT